MYEFSCSCLVFWCRATFIKKKKIALYFCLKCLAVREDSDFRAKKLQLNGGIIENEGSKKS